MNTKTDALVSQLNFEENFYVVFLFVKPGKDGLGIGERFFEIERMCISYLNIEGIGERVLEAKGAWLNSVLVGVVKGTVARNN